MAATRLPLERGPIRADAVDGLPDGLDRRRWLLGAAGLVVGLAGAPAASAAVPAGIRRQLFGSPVDLLLPGPLPAGAEDAVWQGLTRIHHDWHAWKPGTLQRLNHALRAGRTVAVAPALRQLIRRATALERASDGLFNPAIGGLVAAWGFHDDQLLPGMRPDAALLAPWRDARPSLGDLVWDGSLLRSTNPWLQLDFGAYAKGVAIDHALDELQRRGVRDALLNLGGNLAAMGTADGRPWRIGIRDPHGRGLVATLQTAGREAVVTSGSYERFRVLDGRPATHILAPQAGAPAQALVSVTVAHPSAGLADAAATALLVAGPGRWPAVARRMGVDQVLLIDAQGRRVATPAMQARLAPV